MTWHDYLVALPPEERALVYIQDRKASKGYRSHYYRWKVSQQPDYYYVPDKGKAYRLRHKERLQARRKQPEKRAKNRVAVARWRAANPTRDKAHRRKHSQQPQARIRRAVRNRFHQYLKGRRVSQNTTQVVGLTATQLRTYLESLWQPGMSWENYGWGPGKWNIDHKIPLASAKGDLEALLRLQHYTNLQPMWHEENMQKGASLTWGLTAASDSVTMGVS